MAVSLTNASFASQVLLSLFRALIRINVYVLEHEMVRVNCEGSLDGWIALWPGLCSKTKTVVQAMASCC